MRLHVSGVGAGISTTDLREKFSSAGRVLDVFRPEPRQLGTEVIRREFAFVEIADEDRDRAQKIVNVLQGSVWKGHKIRITEARPDYQERIRQESQSSDDEATSACEADGYDCPKNEDTEPEAASQTSYKIRTPQGQVWTLPCSGTGSKKSLFMPVRQLSMEDWFCEELDTAKSSLYHVNDMWKKMVEAQILRPAPDPELFEQAAFPVPMPSQAALISFIGEFAFGVLVTFYLHRPAISKHRESLQVPSRAQAPAEQPEAALTAHENVKKVSESATAMEILSRFDALTSRGEPDHTDKAVSFGDDNEPDANVGPGQAQRMQLQHNSSVLESMSSSDNEDDDQHDIQEGGEAAGRHIEAPLVAFSADQRRQKHILDSTHDIEGTEAAEALDMEDGDQKLSVHRLTAGVDVLGGFTGHMNTDIPNENHTIGERHEAAELQDASSADEEAELLRALLQDNAGAMSAEDGTNSEGEEEGSESDKDAGPQNNAVEASLTVENSGESGESIEQEGNAEDLEAHVDNVELQSGSATSSSSDAEDEPGDAATAALHDEHADLQDDDPWAAAFRLAAGQTMPDKGANESSVQKDEPEEVPAVNIEAAQAKGVQAAKQPSLKRARPPQQEEDADDEEEQEEQKAVETGTEHKSAPAQTRAVPKRVSFAMAEGPSSPGSDGLNDKDSEGDEQMQEGDNMDDMSDDLDAQMQALEQEVLQQQKAAKSSSKPGRSNAKREARRQKRMSAAAKAEPGSEEKGSAAAKPKSRLAQIFREQRDLAEDAEDIEKSPDDTIKSCSAAADALFAQLPFHTSRDGQQVQQEDETEQNDTDAPRTKEKQTQLETADFFIRKFAGAGKPDAQPLKDLAARFKRTEDLAVLEARLKVARPSLLADMKSKLRMHTRRKQATKELYAKKKPKT